PDIEKRNSQSIGPAASTVADSIDNTRVKQAARRNPHMIPSSRMNVPYSALAQAQRAMNSRQALPARASRRRLGALVRFEDAFHVRARYHDPPSPPGRWRSG